MSGSVQGQAVKPVDLAVLKAEHRVLRYILAAHVLAPQVGIEPAQHTPDTPWLTAITRRHGSGGRSSSQDATRASTVSTASDSGASNAQPVRPKVSG